MSTLPCQDEDKSPSRDEQLKFSASYMFDPSSRTYWKITPTGVEVRDSRFTPVATWKHRKDASMRFEPGSVTFARCPQGDIHAHKKSRLKYACFIAKAFGSRSQAHQHIGLLFVGKKYESIFAWSTYHLPFAHDPAYTCYSDALSIPRLPSERSKDWARSTRMVRFRGDLALSLSSAVDVEGCTPLALRYAFRGDVVSEPSDLPFFEGMGEIDESTSKPYLGEATVDLWALRDIALAEHGSRSEK